MNTVCSKCGGEKKGSYLIGSQCGPCIEERRRKRRAEIRREKGLPAWGSGRDPKCKKCREVKESSYAKCAWCRKCKLEHERVRYENKARAEGRPKKRDGINPNCRCGKPKENLKEWLCRECTTIYKRENRRKKYSDPVYRKAAQDKANELFNKNYEARVKKNCRAATNRAIQMGLLIRKNCDKCGTNFNIQAHHEDYTKPMEVVWLCSVHHAEHHKNEKEELKNVN